MKKLKFLHTFKAHHRILPQILCKNTKFQINRIKNKDAMLILNTEIDYYKQYSTEQAARSFMYTLCKDSDKGTYSLSAVRCLRLQPRIFKLENGF